MPSNRQPPNVAIVSGYPWHYSEQQAKNDLSTYGTPLTVRAYEDPANGASRGIFLVEFQSPTQLTEMRERLHWFGPYRITVELLHLAGTWDRAGRLPDTPSDAMLPPDSVEGFGRQGFATRAVRLGLANTVTEDGALEVERLRKRLRDGVPKHAPPS